MPLVDSAVAALLGAGVGSAVAVGAQFLSHGLSTRRDRRNQKRDRLHQVVTEAGAALYRPSRDERASLEEWQQREKHPESMAALNPDLARDTEPLSNRMSEGIALLQVHFGHDHWLIDRYLDACATCLAAEETWSEHSRKPDDVRIAEIPVLAEVMHQAQIARNDWMDEARAAVERV